MEETFCRYGEQAETFYGRKITSVEIDDKVLKIAFEDGSKIRIFDDGQNCCEHRHMTTDDDVKTLIGHKLLRIEPKIATENQKGDEDYFHDEVFLEVATDNSFISIVNHNEHNGYYGGFGLKITMENANGNT